MAGEKGLAEGDDDLDSRRPALWDQPPANPPRPHH